MVLTTIPVGVLGQYVFTLTLPWVSNHPYQLPLKPSPDMPLQLYSALLFSGVWQRPLSPPLARGLVYVRWSSFAIARGTLAVSSILSSTLSASMSSSYTCYLPHSHSTLRLGFATTAVILGGQTLASINANTLPLVVGVIIIGICSLIPCFVGYDMVHVYERYAWIVTLFIMCCLYGLGGKAGYDVNAQKSLEDTGRALSADVLGYGGIIFGALTGWAPIAADYNVRLPADTNPWRVFWLTFFGLVFPSIFTLVLGAALMTITDPAYVAAFGSDGNTGALIAQVLSPWGGGGKFLLVLLALSVMYVPHVPTPSCAHLF